MKFILIIISLLLIPLVFADTTFFDNPNDFFIISSSPTGRVIGGTTGGGGCTYKWNCTNWSECSMYGKQTRNCTNIGTCFNTYKSPEIEQSCTYSALEIEEDKELENKTEELPFLPLGKKIIDKNKTSICFIIVLIILFIIFYLKKNYLKKSIKKIKYQFLKKK